MRQALYLHYPLRRSRRRIILRKQRRQPRKRRLYLIDELKHRRQRAVTHRARKNPETAPHQREDVSRLKYQPEPRASRDAERSALHAQVVVLALIFRVLSEQRAFRRKHPDHRHIRERLLNEGADLSLLFLHLPVQTLETSAEYAQYRKHHYPRRREYRREPWLKHDHQHPRAEKLRDKVYRRRKNIRRALRAYSDVGKHSVHKLRRVIARNIRKLCGKQTAEHFSAQLGLDDRANFFRQHIADDDDKQRAAFSARKPEKLPQGCPVNFFTTHETTSAA